MIRNEDWSTMRRLLFMHGAMGGSLKEYEAEGNPAVFQTNVAKPLAGFTIPFLPIQQGTGDPSPDNVRPISGWQGLTAHRAGKNLLDPAKKTTPSTHIYFYKGNGIYLPAGKYTLSCSKKVAGLFVHAMDNTQVVTGYNNTAKSFTLSEGQTVYINFYDTNIDTTMDCQLEVGETASPYTEYTGASYPVTFPAVGKNLLKPSVIAEGFDRFYSVSGDVLTVLGNDDGGWGGSRKGVLLKAGTYTLSRSFPGGRVQIYKNGTESRLMNHGVSSASFTLTEETIVKFKIGTSYPAESGGESYPISTTLQLEAGSTATAYEPYTNTVYGGTLDAVTGVLTVEWKATEIKGTTSLYGGASNYDGTEGTNRMAIITPTGLTERSQKGFSDAMKVAKNGTWAEPNNFIWQFCINASDQLHMVFENATVGITEGMTANERTTAIKAWLADNPITFVLPLATPIEIQLDPLTISTLIGDNTIWTDTNGSNTIKYKKKG